MQIEKEDEMECLVSGCNFLLKAIRHEAFTFENNQTQFKRSHGESIYCFVCESDAAASCTRWLAWRKNGLTCMHDM